MKQEKTKSGSIVFVVGRLDPFFSERGTRRGGRERKEEETKKGKKGKKLFNISPHRPDSFVIALA